MHIRMAVVAAAGPTLRFVNDTRTTTGAVLGAEGKRLTDPQNWSAQI